MAHSSISLLGMWRVALRTILLGIMLTCVFAIDVYAVGSALAERNDDSWIGVIYSQQAVEVSAQVEGNIRSVNVGLGGRVAIGDILAVLDIPELKEEEESAEAEVLIAIAELDQAKANVNLRHRELRRRKEAGNSVALEELELSEGQYIAAKSNQRTAQARLHRASAEKSMIALKKDKTIIKATSDGVVAQSLPQVGSLIKSGQLITTVVSQDQLLVRFALPETTESMLSVGDVLEVFNEGSDTLGAVVQAIAPSIDPITRLTVVEARLMEPAAGLLGRGVKVRVANQ